MECWERACQEKAAPANSAVTAASSAQRGGDCQESKAKDGTCINRLRSITTCATSLPIKIYFCNLPIFSFWLIYFNLQTGARYLTIWPAGQERNITLAQNRKVIQKRIYKKVFSSFFLLLQEINQKEEEQITAQYSYSFGLQPEVHNLCWMALWILFNWSEGKTFNWKYLEILEGNP